MFISSTEITDIELYLNIMVTEKVQRQEVWHLNLVQDLDPFLTFPLTSSICSKFIVWFLDIHWLQDETQYMYIVQCMSSNGKDGRNTILLMKTYFPYKLTCTLDPLPLPLWGSPRNWSSGPRRQWEECGADPGGTTTSVENKQRESNYQTYT